MTARSLLAGMAHSAPAGGPGVGALFAGLTFGSSGTAVEDKDYETVHNLTGWRTLTSKDTLSTIEQRNLLLQNGFVTGAYDERFRSYWYHDNQTEQTFDVQLPAGQYWFTIAMGSPNSSYPGARCIYRLWDGTDGQSLLIDTRSFATTDYGLWADAKMNAEYTDVAWLANDPGERGELITVTDRSGESGTATGIRLGWNGTALGATPSFCDLNYIQFYSTA